MVNESLQAKLATYSKPVDMLRNAPLKLFSLAYAPQHSNWRDEQAAWMSSAVLFDQSNHMNDAYFKGPDVVRLMSDTGINSFKNFGRNKSKQFMVCGYDGNLIGTSVLFGLEDDEVSLVGPSACANWVQYQAEIGGYDVEVTWDRRTADSDARRRLFRYEIEGPLAKSILEKATDGALPEVRFFGMTEFDLGGAQVRALKHTMAGAPGDDNMGLEIWGPSEDGPRVLDALLSAGEEFGLVRGGALAYYSSGIESGYLSQPVPGIYTDERMRAYREWLPGDGYEAKISIAGSFASDDIEDYYRTPWDMDYGHIMKFDHDFIGREALEATKDEPRKRKVWLRWNDEDATRVITSSLFSPRGTGAKFLDMPLGRYARVQFDQVRAQDELVGISAMCGYTVNVGGFFSLGMLDADAAVDGKEVSVVWGEENGGTAKLGVERHVQTEIRATVHTSAPIR
ncbi:aminomethyl transferase family protein [Pseudonocardia kujensis]|uniref:aminomethyl transferase family protein n=1 Tax=Pseudonocardia kujensis TaxID=1128675 RepID=UPI001E42F70A|nr:aminomethyl transferase family protein [Pseudonocardia kujensis]MCE0762054.1 aminomethyl transferase family protein [Pseudonocardia kujensis]